MQLSLADAVLIRSRGPFVIFSYGATGSLEGDVRLALHAWLHDVKMALQNEWHVAKVKAEALHFPASEGLITFMCNLAYQ